MKDKLKTDLDLLLNHPIYSEIKSIQDLQIFMRAHIFAVWDFMSITKRLQVSLTCVSLPWLPPKNSSSARLINEIIFYEETDINKNKEASSHLEMYMHAMKCSLIVRINQAAN